MVVSQPYVAATVTRFALHGADEVASAAIPVPYEISARGPAAALTTGITDATTAAAAATFDTVAKTLEAPLQTSLYLIAFFPT